MRDNPFDAKSDNIEPLLTWYAHDDYFVNEHDSPDFYIRSEDLDGLQIDSESGFPTDSANMAFGNFYSIDTANLMPNDQETAHFIAACSWFEYDQCCADNWFEFGPVTIPNSGATLRFSYKGVTGYEDGFEVLLSTTGMDNIFDFTNPAVFFKADQSYEGGKWHTDGVIIDGFTYGGLKLYFAFHHNAHNMSRLRLDNFQVIKLIK